MNQFDDILIGILANGQSKRMGYDKATMPFMSGNLLEYQLDRLSQMGFDQIAVNNYLHLDDPIPDCGPLSGIYTLLLEAEKRKLDQLVILPIDMPLLNEQCLKTLMIADNQADISYLDRNIMPMKIDVNHEIIQKLKRFISISDNFAIRAFFDQVKVDAIPHDFEDVLFSNLNRPQDVELAEKYLAEGQG